MQALPEIEALRPNLTRVRVGPLTIWYSYTTPVAFTRYGDTPTVRANTFSSTTGRHLNLIDGGGVKAGHNRLDGPAFERALMAAVDAA